MPLIAQNKAILIGISEYQAESGWCNISAHNDVVLLQTTLSPKWDVVTLEDEQATHNSIINLLNNIAATAAPSDTILVHFSCHGQQMMPVIDNGDEPDRLDEALIPYDALKDWSPNYDGHNHLRDNELADCINQIRDRVGENGIVIVTLDACHSDSMQKDDGNGAIIDTTIYRGTPDIFGDPDAITDSIIRKRYIRDTCIIEINNNSPVLYLSACQAHSQNAEIVLPNGKGYGSLSYSIAEAFMNNNYNDITAFLDRVIVIMDSLVPYQVPGVRASFKYSKPEPQKKNVIIEDNQEDAIEKSHHLTFLFIIAAIALLIVLIWKITKR